MIGILLAALSGFTGAQMLYRIQALRGIAAYGVVLFHIVEHLRGSYGIDVPRFTIGAAGVDLFFVISGFIMVHVTKDHEGPGSFAAKRFGRIVPLYWIATASAIVLIAVAPWSFPKADLSTSSIVSSLLFLPAVDLAGGIQPILFVGWTLQYEMAFYALFALALFAPPDRRISTVTALLLAGWLLANSLPPGTASTFYADAIVLEFLAGVLIGAAANHHRLPSPRLASYLVVLAITGFVVGEFLLRAYELHRVFAAGIPASFLIYAAVALDLRKPRQNPTLLTHLGDSSYSAYIWHPIVIVVVTAICQKLFGQTIAAAILFSGLAAISTIIGSEVSLRLIERPSSQIVRSLTRNRTPAS
ncbi:MAG: acyltransferase [Pseudomonadota bacterium]